MALVVDIGGRRVSLNSRKAIGKGGEADVYVFGRDRVLKVWKGPNHPDLVGLPLEQEAARRRLEVMQRKISAFPSGLPDRLVMPMELARGSGKRSGVVVGFTMRRIHDAVELHRLSQRKFRESGFGWDQVKRVFLDLEGTLYALHAAGVVVGDFNDLNVLVRDGQAFLIDVDSYQLPGFPCRVFTERFLDPLLSDGAEGRLTLDRPFGASSDWYAFAVQLMQSLLFVGPYGGVLRPNDGSGVKIAAVARPLHRLTVFDSRVRYPGPAAPLASLPDDLLHHLHEIFVKDLRVPFPRSLIAELELRRCGSCGLEHGRAACPRCAHRVQVPRAPVKVVVRGALRATQLFRTEGAIVAVAAEGGRALWLAHEGGRFLREGGGTVLRGDVTPDLRFRLLGRETLVARGDRLVVIDEGGETDRLVSVDRCGGRPVFDVGGGRCFRAEGGALLRDDAHGPEVVGQVLAGQTMFWVGPSFGFGFYRAGELDQSFVFDVGARGLRDDLRLPKIRGKLSAARCVLDRSRCWLLTASEHSGRTWHRCLVIDSRGALLASEEREASGHDWLESLEAGMCAARGSLFVATDAGIVRLAVRARGIDKIGEFPETEPFVAECRDLLAHDSGLIVTTRQTITMLAFG